ncbi:hypothetical protein PC123_g9991 [Phytophthora cactorum]|nr:hypothetical protein PC123_g9991 [Phytophthora cactorum]
MEAGEGANASLPSAESNGEDLFRLLKFVRETQCEMEVVKPVLDELEVMRMCRSFGMMSSVNPKDFDFNVLHAREFDDDFVRFLRFELFENACPGDVKLKGLFGKQAQVADALVDLKACSIGTVASLAGATDGIYCVKINPESNEGQSNGEKNVAGLVVFSWIRDELFEPKELRDTPAFVLRFLTGLTPDIICSTSPSDLEQVATAMTTSDEQEDDELSSYSVSFHIEKQEDQPDSSSCVAVSSVDLEALPEDCSNICLLKGSYPAIAVTRTMNSVIRPKQFRRIFHSHMQLSFAEWLKAESQHCRIDLNPVIVRSAKLCQNILKAFDMWPEDEMNAAWEAQEKKEQQDYALAAQQLKEEIANQRAIVDQVSNELFQLRGSDTANPALITSLQTALSVYESFREWIRSTCLRKIDRNIQLTLDAPNCLRKVEAKLFAVYSYGDVGELGKLLEMCATTPRPDLVKAVNNRKAKTPKPEVTVEASETTWKSFMEKVSEPLIKLRTKWWIAVESVLAATNEVEPKKLKSKHKTAWYDHVRPIIESKFEQLRQFLLSKDGLLITVSACPRGRGNVYCEGTKEVYAPPSVCQDIVKLNMQVGKTKSATGRQELLGQHLVAPGENYVAMFTVKVRSAVKICTGKERMCVKFIYFPPSTDSRRPSRANEKVIRTLGKFASLCDYDARNRIMTFLSEDSVGIYKFDESFRKMERMKVVDLGVRSTLAELPFRDVLLLDSTVYVTDSSGCSQGIDIHNDQTSNVMNVHDETSLSCSRLLELADNLAIGVVSRVASDDGAFEGVLKCISRDDNRHLPDLRLGVKFLTDRVNVQCVDDGVLVLDPLAQKVYFFSVRVTVRSDSYRMRQSDNGGSKASESDSSNADCPRKQHWMYAFYHVFEKFPVRGLLDVGVPSPVSILVACSGVEETNAALENYHDFLSLLMSDLMALNKPLHGLDLTSGLKVQRSLAGVTMKSKPLKSLFQTLITFLPVQICRAEGNALTVLHDGMDQSLEPEDEFQAWGAADIAESIRFGLLSPLLCAWRGRCVVITSMGKQSTGKSYFLNHLTGSSFAIAGNRCTDGAWMTLRIMQDVLLVVLDFEGLGSFERTDQEDVFLSVLNASLSMFTIFRMEMRFDKDIDGLFTKFQKGINLLKNDERLFQGTLYMSVKDVNPNDRHGVLSEFQRKFQKLLTVNRDRNFLTEMYSGKLKINCSPPLGTLGYYDSLRHARQLIETLVNDPDLSSRGFKSGSSYHDCIRLVLAKISILDWTAVDESSQRLEMNELHRKLPGAIRTGCLIPAEAQTKNESLPRSLKDPLLHDKSLLCMLGLGQLSRDYPEFSECWAIVNQEVTLDEMDDEDVDFGPSACFQANAGTSSIHFTLQNLFQRYLALTAKGPLEKIMGKDYANFDAIVSFLVCRRKTKVILWVKQLLGTERFMDEWEQIEQTYILPFEALFRRCLHSCAKCQLQCMRSACHSFDEDHDCGMSHTCRGLCEYCALNYRPGKEMPRCVGQAGHEGKCDCVKGDHTCGAGCSLIGASNCGGLCVLIGGHDGDHRCSVKQHACGAACSATKCRGKCILNTEHRHTVHKCAETQCKHACKMDGCKEWCSTANHFHDQFELGVKFAEENGQRSGTEPSLLGKIVHLCNSRHTCNAPCEMEGICARSVQVSMSKFSGSCDTFDYELKQMVGVRNKCAIVLQPGETNHDGIAHSCVKVLPNGTKSVHGCGVRCEACEYYCDKPIGHEGEHSAAHGNMRNMHFVAEDDVINWEDRKYVPGEKGVAEMCNMHCSSAGRGHVHYSNHVQSTRSMSFYMKNIGKQSAEHNGEGKSPSYCDLEAWHLPAATPSIAERRGFSYVSGHRFACSHASTTGKVHHVFVLDCSGSMRGDPWEELVSGVRGYLQSRLAAGVKQDIVSVVTFGNQGIIEFEGVPIRTAPNRSIDFHGGGTFYSNGLNQANAIFSRTNLSVYKPVMIFFTDGRPADRKKGPALAVDVRKRFAKFGLRTFVVGYGRASDMGLEDLAEKLGGSVHEALTTADLREAFRSISVSLGARAGLIHTTTAA